MKKKRNKKIEEVFVGKLHRCGKKEVSKEIVKKKILKFVKIMKCGWCDTIKNALFHHRTPFNVAVIIEQLSNCNNMLRKIISEENV